MKWRHQTRAWYTSTPYAVAFVIVGEVLVGLLIFHAGVAYGERRVLARMSEDSQHEFGFFSHSYIPSTHGAVGIISSISSPVVVLTMRDGSVRRVTVSSSTMIRGPKGSQPELSVGQSVTALGDPDDVQNNMNARVIQVLSTKK